MKKKFTYLFSHHLLNEERAAKCWGEIAPLIHLCSMAIFHLLVTRPGEPEMIHGEERFPALGLPAEPIRKRGLQHMGGRGRGGVRMGRRGEWRIRLLSAKKTEPSVASEMLSKMLQLARWWEFKGSFYCVSGSLLSRNPSGWNRHGSTKRCCFRVWKKSWNWFYIVIEALQQQK